MSGSRKALLAAAAGLAAGAAFGAVSVGRAAVQAAHTLPEGIEEGIAITAGDDEDES